MIHWKQTQSNKKTYVHELNDEKIAIRIYQQENPNKYSLQYRITGDKHYHQYKTINESNVESQLHETISLIKTVGKDEFIKFVETYKQEKNRNSIYEIISIDEKIKMRITQNKTNGLSCKVFDTPIDGTEPRYFTLTNKITTFPEAQEYIEKQMTQYNETGKYQRNLLRKGDIELTHEIISTEDNAELFSTDFIESLQMIINEDDDSNEKPSFKYSSVEKQRFLTKMERLYNWLIIQKIDPNKIIDTINMGVIAY